MINSNLKNAKILIVDDQSANIDILEGLLQLQGYENILSTSDPRNFIQMFTDFKPDLILLDLFMPFLTGFEVMELLKSLIPGQTYLPILILTADVTPQAKQNALSSGAHDFLTKPFDLIEVGLRIKNLLFTCFLQQQLQNQNQVLEERVKERTDDLVRTNYELVAAKEKAEAGDRLKTAFIQNISHEIRTPLNGILGFGSLLTENDLTKQEKMNYFELMRSSSNRLTKTITDFMDISLIVSLNMTVNLKMVNIIKLLVDIKEQLRKSYELKKLIFNLVLPDNQRELYILTDSELLIKIILHILDNALKFTDKGGITLGYNLKPEVIEFYIIDTGVGIDENAQKRMFESFEQENMSNTRNHEGSGLGLSISKKLVELLGGHIWLRSSKSEGTTIYFTIPDNGIRNEENAGKSNNSEKKADNHIKHCKVLVAEDDEVSKLFLTELIQKYCNGVMGVRTGLEAVDACRDNPDINLVLMDIRMPGIDGYEATRKIREFNQKVIIIAQTAYALKGDKDRALNAGCNDSISKPINQAALIDLIRKYFA